MIKDTICKSWTSDQLSRGGRFGSGGGGSFEGGSFRGSGLEESISGRGGSYGEYDEIKDTKEYG